MNKKLKIIIFDGTFKATTFINRLVEGLLINHDVYIFGFNENVKQKIKGVNYVGLGSNTSKLLYIKRSIQLRGWNVLTLLKFIALLFFKRKKQITKENIQLAIDKINPDIIHFQWVSVLPYLESLKLPIHTKTIFSQRGFHINIRPFIDKDNMGFLKKVYPKINGFHSVSNAIKEKSKQIYDTPLKIDKVVYSGFEFNNIPVKKNNKFLKVFNVISVGRNHWIKDYKNAINAIYLLKNKGVKIHYTIVGVDKDEELLFLVANLGLQKYITFIANVNQQKVYKYMVNADLLLLSSIQEGIANVCIEAMFCKLPVLSTNCGGMSELITDGETGFLVPTRQPNIMAKKIETIIKIKSNVLFEITEKARAKVIQQHNKQKMLTDMEALYKKVKLSNN